MYHRISEVRRDSLVPGHYVSPRLLEKHVSLVKRFGYPLVGPAELLAGRRGALFTFDDGYLDYFEAAVPILSRAGGVGLVFLVSDWVGKTNGWDEAEGDVTERLMDWDQAREVRRIGMAIGSHTMRHARLATLEAPAVAEELAGSKARIEAELGEACEWFCYPYGSMSEAVTEAVRAAGYRAAFATTKGAFGPGSDPYRIPRINVRADTTPAILAYKLFRAVVFGR
jgi:peptidoglycan/xylan/chitin deacetylase (PgdA/CDA1 family)